MSVMVQHEERLERGRLAQLTIDNASKLNSLNRALMAEIIEAVDGLAADPQLRLVVLTGAGDRACKAAECADDWRRRGGSARRQRPAIEMDGPND